MSQNDNNLKIILLIAALNFSIKYGNAQSASGAEHKAPTGKYSAGVLPKDVKKMNDEDAYTSYAVYNDSSSIYIKLYITDSLQKRKVFQNGMEVWIDAKGKKNKTTGILFPLPAGGPAPFSQTGFNRKIADTSLPMLVEKRQEMELKGFAGGINGKQMIGTVPAGVSVAFYLVGDTLIYEAVVAFNTVGIVAPGDKPVSIGIVEKGIDLPGFGDMGGGPGGDEGGGPPGGGEGGPPPGPPPGGPQDGGFDFRRLFETDTFWYKLKPHN